MKKKPKTMDLILIIVGVYLFFFIILGRPNYAAGTSASTTSTGSTPKVTAPNVLYRVWNTGAAKYLDYQYDSEKSGGQDGYAGIFGKTIERVQITLSQ